MKKLFITIVFLCVSIFSFAQVSWVAKAGLNISSYYGQYADNAKIKCGWRAGAGVDIPINKTISFQPSLYLTNKGGKYKPGTILVGEVGLDNNYTINEYYIEVPADILFRFPITEDGANFTFAIGPYAAAGIAGKAKIDGVSSGKSNTFGNTWGYRKFDAGANIEIAFEISKHYIVGASGQFGFVKIKESNEHKQMSELRNHYPYNLNCSFNLGYRF